MSDSPVTPAWGFALFDERDLDILLAGQLADVPASLRPVADVLTALRAGPVHGELSGEEQAMAEFRALSRAQADDAGPAAVTQPVASPSPAFRSPRRPAARHRRPAPLAWPGNRRVLMGAAAAAALVVAVVGTGSFFAPLGSHRAAARPAAAGPAAGSASPRVEVTHAAVEPTATPGQSAATSCRAYYVYLGQSAEGPALPAETSLWQQLTRLAGSQDPGQVSRYCARYVPGLVPAQSPRFGTGSGNAGGGYSGGQGGGDGRHDPGRGGHGRGQGR